MSVVWLYEASILGSNLRSNLRYRNFDRKFDPVRWSSAMASLDALHKAKDVSEGGGEG